MQIISNTPRSRPPRGQQQSKLTWIFFVLILARPLWGILRTMVGPQIGDAQLWMLVGGGLGVALIAILLVRGRGSRPPVTQQPGMPAPMSLPTPRTYTAPSRTGMPSAPRFEPMITGKAFFAGLCVVALAIGLLALVWLG